ncbi:T9SS type A sorting domain-containing protein, partial [bacterium]|nr:T9SS type A sorting domain-containing protein [bacterium]
GRITADNLTEIQNVIHKIIWHQNMPVVADARRVLLAGELLWSDPLSYGADFLELLIGTHSDSGYTTQGMPSDLYFTRLYDKNQSWSASDIIAEINNGCNLLFHNGHASAQGVMRLNSASLRETIFAGADGVNHPFPLVYSHGCLAARFDSDDSIGELFVTLPNFAVAFIGNTRYGWFNEGQIDGPSTHLNREFINAIYGHGITSLSAAHAQSQIATAPFVDLPREWESGATRWTFYSCNVLGDPALELWTNAIAYFSTVNCPETIPLETRQLTIGTGIRDAVVVLSNANKRIFQGVTDGNGQATIAIEPDSTVDEWTLMILKHNYVPFVRVISVNDFGTGIQDDIIIGTDDFSVSPAWPNPFNATTTFRYSQKFAGLVTARIVNLQGQVITELLHQKMAAGRHELQWQAVDALGNELPSGIYFLEIASPEERLVRPCMLLK